MFSEFFEVAVILFLVMDPIANAFAINSLLNKFDTKKRAKIILRELYFALIILVVSLFIGLFIFKYINFSTTTLNTTGGILLLFIAYQIYFKPEVVSAHSLEVDPYIFPIAFPLIAGPSAISILLILSSRNPEKISLWIFAVVICWLFATIILFFSPKFVSKIEWKKLRFIEKCIAVILILLAIRLIKMGFQDF